MGSRNLLAKVLCDPVDVKSVGDARKAATLFEARRRNSGQAGMDASKLLNLRDRVKNFDFRHSVTQNRVTQ